MGLNISATKFVAFDDTHHKRIDTSLDGNPTKSVVEGLLVQHIFRRNKTGDKERDGNPLIYALKGMHGYQIMPLHREQFMTRARQIVDSFAMNLNADYIMPLASSYGLSREVADLICDVTGTAYLSPDFIRKKTIQEMLHQYGDNVPVHLNQRASRAYKAQLATWRQMNPRQQASMKQIEPAIRRCFDPLTLDAPTPGVTGARVVVVDDLMSTGASLTSAAKLLAGVGCIVSSGVCFVSGL